MIKAILYIQMVSGQKLFFYYYYYGFSSFDGYNCELKLFSGYNFYVFRVLYATATANEQKKSVFHSPGNT